MHAPPSRGTITCVNGMALASPPPQTLVMFGASGDLVRRKLLPSIYDLAYEGLMPERYAIVGSGGSPLDDAGFRERAREGVEEFSRHRPDEARWQAFAERLFYEDAGIAHLPAHDLALRIQPDEGISLVFRAMEPGPGMALDAATMNFSYGGSFRTRPTEAYERLLHDAMAGDQTLFLREDAVERSWEIVAPILDGSGAVHPCAAGTWGPGAAEELIAPRAWPSC
jgi:glucose-6-phosphate 1-dehydrogenase